MVVQRGKKKQKKKKDENFQTKSLKIIRADNSLRADKIFGRNDEKFFCQICVFLVTDYQC